MTNNRPFPYQTTPFFVLSDHWYLLFTMRVLARGLTGSCGEGGQAPDDFTALHSCVIWRLHVHRCLSFETRYGCVTVIACLWFFFIFGLSIDCVSRLDGTLFAVVLPVATTWDQLLVEAPLPCCGQPDLRDTRGLFFPQTTLGRVSQVPLDVWKAQRAAHCPFLGGGCISEDASPIRKRARRRPTSEMTVRFVVRCRLIRILLASLTVEVPSGERGAEMTVMGAVAFLVPYFLFSECFRGEKVGADFCDGAGSGRVIYFCVCMGFEVYMYAENLGHTERGGAVAGACLLCTLAMHMRDDGMKYGHCDRNSFFLWLRICIFAPLKQKSWPFFFVFFFIFLFSLWPSLISNPKMASAV